MKRVLTAIMAIMLLACFMSALASAPGAASDPLVSLDYLRNTFYPTLMSESKALVLKGVNTLYDNASGKMQQIHDSAIQQLGGTTDYTFAGSFIPVSLTVGKSVELTTGSTIVLLSGSAGLQIIKGTVINISNGSEVPSGSALALNQKYLCAEETTAVITSTTDVVCQVDGYYKTTGTVISNPGKFKDVRITDWYFTAVSFVTGKSLFTGTTETTFSPDASMTRGMFVTVLYRLAGKPPVNAAPLFADVGSADAYYYNAVIWANTNKIVTGFDDGKFHPDDLITREQMAVIMYRYAVLSGYNTVSGSTDAFAQFPDKAKVSPFAADAMGWAVSAKLVSGSDGRLLPQNTATRSQVAQIIMNFCRSFTA